VRPFASGTDGWLEAPILVKPTCLRLHLSPDVAVQEEQRAARRIRRAARALTRREKRRLERRSARAAECTRGLCGAELRRRPNGPARPPGSLVRGGLCEVRGVSYLIGYVVEVVGWQQDSDVFLCQRIEPRYGGKPPFFNVPFSAAFLLPERFLFPVLARPGPIAHPPPGQRGQHWKVQTHAGTMRLLNHPAPLL
jgi:hypothetical protein